jgi:hypothetical protein
MTEENKDIAATETAQIEADQPKTKTRSKKDVSIHNSSARPITLIGDRTPESKVTILPTETVQIKGDLWAKLEENEAAQTYFTIGELRKV